MHPSKLFALILTIALSHSSVAQTKVPADASAWTAYKGTATFDNGVIHVTNKSDENAILWLNNNTMKNGVITLDIKGKDLAGQSFVGLAFHATGDKDYEGVYFRPFNFRNQERRDHAVQYISKPKYDWNFLRQNYPGKYENPIEPAPDPNDWFQVKIVIEFPMVSVYVNESKEPVLDVEQISQRSDGKIGLWVDSEDGWFKNITISKK